jgi:hypothetical protein
VRGIRKDVVGLCESIIISIDPPHLIFLKGGMKMTKKIPLDKNDFSSRTYIDIFGPSDCILYKDKIPMWRTGCGLNKVDIFISTDIDGTTIICRDHMFGDSYTYGYWDTLEECKAWLEDPTILY